MANTNCSEKRMNDLLEALFDERTFLYDKESLPEPGKTPTTPVRRADLAATVDGEKGDLGPNSTPSQQLHARISLHQNITIELKLEWYTFQIWSHFHQGKKKKKREHTPVMCSSVFHNCMVINYTSTTTVTYLEFMGVKRKAKDKVRPKEVAS